MLSRFFLFTFVCSFVGFASAQDAGESPNDVESLAITDARTRKTVSLDTLISDLARQDVIFLGEQHDNDAGHLFQLNVIKGLLDLDIPVVISMEQFERDVQGAVNDYLAGRITEEQFLASSRPWKNYKQHYRAIVELAKEKRVPILAANVPRRLASDVSKNQKIKMADKVFLPRTTTAPEDAYWQKFLATMSGHGGAGDENKMASFYASQCLKDDAMAEAITDYLAINSHQHKVVVHLCGHFHSDYGLGTVSRVIQRVPLARTVIVTMEMIPEEGAPDVEKACSRAHYVFWIKKN